MDDDPVTPEPEASLEGLLESFLTRLRAGESPTVEEYAARHPHLADQIRETFPVAELMEQMGEEDAAAPAPASESDPAPERIGEYRILREIGRGGMGVVYEAQEETLGRRVALKVLPHQSMANPSHRERFRREVRAAAALQHPNIVPVFAVGEEPEASYYAMQYIRGQPLDAVVEELRARASNGARLSATSRKLMPESSDASARSSYFRNVARLGADVANALAYSHAEGILHRDIKPSNSSSTRRARCGSPTSAWPRPRTARP